MKKGLRVLLAVILIISLSSGCVTSKEQSGALTGAAVGAAVGNSDTAQRAAGAGAVVGGAKGTGRGVAERDRVVRNCLRNRGYAVLN